MKVIRCSFFGHEFFIRVHLFIAGSLPLLSCLDLPVASTLSTEAQQIFDLSMSPVLHASPPAPTRPPAGHQPPPNLGPTAPSSRSLQSGPPPSAASRQPAVAPLVVFIGGGMVQSHRRERIGENRHPTWYMVYQYYPRSKLLKKL
jgi:hypothetical protein